MSRVCGVTLVEYHTEATAFVLIFLSPSRKDYSCSHALSLSLPASQTHHRPRRVTAQQEEMCEMNTVFTSDAGKN
ncbi:Oxygen-dependent coproporphyrinogen-III oxidase [Clarias magur]|uniref:Oxygen-dependent coproporphyrinogen-III oxidase n=1 Tax=Clarias magur TaxID=1594786 RepID=A0A8J4UVR0_CLAMG|nr:Oxygen-dependent coproporphyrinogen-III oxidase [Clarias magur]